MLGIQVKQIPNPKSPTNIIQISSNKKYTNFFASFYIIGPTLPYGLDNSAMVEIPDGVLLFGGYGNDENGYKDRQEILELRAGANSWNILDIALEEGRSDHVVIPLQ